MTVGELAERTGVSRKTIPELEGRGPAIECALDAVAASPEAGPPFQTG